MAPRRFSLLLRGLYGTAIVAFLLQAPDAAGQAKKPTAGKSAASKAAKPKPAEHDPQTEWDLVQRAAIELRAQIAHAPTNEALRQDMAALARRSAIGAERALAIGSTTLFESYKEQYQVQFRDTVGHLGRLADEGDGAAHYALGVVALHRFLESASVEAACSRFLAALAARYTPAKFRSAQCLERSDPVRSVMLLWGAADSGHPVAEEVIGRTCLRANPADTSCAWNRLSTAAAAGRPTAQSLLAWMHIQGAGGRAADPAQALRLYTQAAQAGHAPAQNNLGEIYEIGRGVSADPKQAMRWYRKAAEAGFAPAQFNLGRLGATGRGTPQDAGEAQKWLEQAERAGIAEASKVLQWMRRKSDK